MVTDFLYLHYVRILRIISSLLRRILAIKSNGNCEMSSILKRRPSSCLRGAGRGGGGGGAAAGGRQWRRTTMNMQDKTMPLQLYEYFAAILHHHALCTNNDEEWKRLHIKIWLGLFQLLRYLFYKTAYNAKISQHLKWYHTPFFVPTLIIIRLNYLHF